MTQLLAVTSAAFFGFADFAGGKAARSLSAWRVTAWTEIFGIPLLLVGLLIVPAPAPRMADLAYGAAAGLIGLIGLSLLYAALAAGSMSVVAPIVGTVSAVIPIGFDILTGNQIKPAHWIGITMALVGVTLIASHTTTATAPLTGRVLGLTLGASAAFAIFYITIAQTSSDSGLWPIVAARGVAIPVAVAVAAIVATAAIPPPENRNLVATAGSFDMIANIAILLALQAGPLALNVVLTSLYPAFTVLAAVVLLREHPAPRQVVGIVLALGAVAVLAL